jgi:hypothetical protein
MDGSTISRGGWMPGSLVWMPTSASFELSFEPKSVDCA